MLNADICKVDMTINLNSKDKYEFKKTLKTEIHRFQKVARKKNLPLKKHLKIIN